MKYRVKFNGQFAPQLNKYGYSLLNDQLEIDNAIALMDLAVCVHEIADGNSPVLHASATISPTSNNEITVIDMTSFYPNKH